MLRRLLVPQWCFQAHEGSIAFDTSEGVKTGAMLFKDINHEDD